MDFDTIKWTIIIGIAGWFGYKQYKKQQEKVKAKEVGYINQSDKDHYSAVAKAGINFYEEYLKDLKIAGLDVNDKKVKAMAFKDVCLNTHRKPTSLFPTFRNYPFRLSDDQIENIYYESKDLTSAFEHVTRLVNAGLVVTDGGKRIIKYIERVDRDDFTNIKDLNADAQACLELFLNTDLQDAGEQAKEMKKTMDAFELDLSKKFSNALQRHLTIAKLKGGDTYTDTLQIVKNISPVLDIVLNMPD